MRRWTPLQPSLPLWRDDGDQAGKVASPLPFDRPVLDVDVAQPTERLEQGRLHGRPAHTGQSTDLIDVEVADAMMLHLAGNDAKHGALAFGVEATQNVGEG